MADIAIFRINYKSDFILTLQSDAGWTTPFCIKFWTGAPSKAYYAYYDGMSYTHCTPVEGEPTKLLVQFDDHHLPIGDLKFQIGYHFTVADFPTSVEDEVINQAAVIIDNDGERKQVMLDFNGETAPEIEFSLPAYANEAQRIANEQARIAAEEQRIVNEQARISAEETRQTNEQQRINQETARVSEFARLKTESEAATDAATSAANTANASAQNADEKATLANQKAQLAADKAALAQAAATLADDKAQLAADKASLAQQKADYAQTQGNYAKAQGDAAKTEAETAHSLNEEVSHDESTRQQQETARQEAEAQRATDFNTQMQQQQTAYTEAEAARETAFNEAEQQRDAKVDEKVADITNLQAQVGYFVCDTAAATAAKTIAATGYVLGTGGNIRIKMTNDNTADNATLNINSTGAKPLFYEGARASSANTWADGNVLEIYYDGTNYQAKNVSPTFKTGEKVNSVGVDDEPTTGSENVVKSGGVADVYGTYIESSEWIKVITDNLLRVIEGIKKDGTKVIGGNLLVFGSINGVKDLQYVQKLAYSVVDKVDKENNKTLVNAPHANSLSSIEDVEDRLEIKLDLNNKIISYRDKNGVLHEYEIDSEYIKANTAKCNIVYANKIITPEIVFNNGISFLRDKFIESGYIIQDSPVIAKFNVDDVIKDYSEEAASIPHSTEIFSVLYEKMDALVEAYPDFIQKVDAFEYVRDEMAELGVTDYPRYANGIAAGDAEYLETPAYKTYMYIVDYGLPKWGNNTYNKHKNVFIVAGTHGAEQISQINTYLFAKELCSGTVDKNYFALRNSCKFFIVPMLCGYATYHRTRQNANGVNINRNFLSAEGFTVREEPGDRDYTGPSAYSEFETKLIKCLTEKIIPDVFIDHHSYNQEMSNQIYYGTITSAEIARCFYQASIDVSHALQKAYPEYFGNHGKLLLDEPSGSTLVPSIESSRSGQSTGCWAYHVMGIRFANTIEISNTINYYNGVPAVVPNTGIDYETKVFGIAEYSLRVNIIRILERLFTINN